MSLSLWGDFFKLDLINAQCERLVLHINVHSCVVSARRWLTEWITQSASPSDSLDSWDEAVQRCERKTGGVKFTAPAVKLLTSSSTSLLRASSAQRRISSWIICAYSESRSSLRVWRKVLINTSFFDQNICFFTCKEGCHIIKQLKVDFWTSVREKFLIG